MVAVLLLRGVMDARIGAAVLLRAHHSISISGLVLIHFSYEERPHSFDDHHLGKAFSLSRQRMTDVICTELHSGLSDRTCQSRE